MLRIVMVVDRPRRPPTPPVLLRALVDSGADRTTLPLKIAWELGIQQDELILHPGGGRGVKSRFDVWTVFTVTFEEGRGRIFPSRHLAIS